MPLDLMDVIRRTRADLGELELFASVCQDALAKAGSALAQLDLVDRIDTFLGDQKRFATPEARAAAEVRAREIETFALDQRCRGFPYLYSLALVRLWGILEACVDDLVSRALSDLDKCKDPALLFRLKGPLLEFRSASTDEQSEFLADLLKNAVDGPLKLGIGRFESVLEPCGLGGGTDDLLRRALLELSQVRNLVVHKSGRVDKRILEHCPWIRRSVGSSLHPSEKDFALYRAAAYWYLLELTGRVRRRDGLGDDVALGAVIADLSVATQAAWANRDSESRDADLLVAAN